MRPALRIATLAAIVGLAACGGTSPTVSPAPGSTPSASVCAFAGGTVTTGAPASGGVMLLTAVRAAAHPCFDRIVFEFRQRSGRNGTPGYRVEYRSGPFVADPSGKPLHVAGSAFLSVRLEPASGADLTTTPIEVTYKGPQDLKPAGTAHVVEIREAGDFENVMSWVIGLRSERPYLPTVLRAGSDIRLVVDVG